MLTSSTPTTLLDLPLELHEYILLEAIVSEIRDRKLVRCGWKDSADRLVNRLRTVCPQWDSVLTTNSFRNRLHGIIDTFPSVELRWDCGDLCDFSTWCIAVDALDDEYFLLCQLPNKHAAIRICKGDDLEKAIRVIQLPAVTVPWNLVACRASSCLYLLHKTSDSVEILRVYSKEGQQSRVSSFIRCSPQLVSRMCVSADGSLVMYQGPAPSTITTYNADGLLQRQIELTKPLSFVRDIFSKSNGNVIILSSSLTEINRDGDILFDYDTQEDGGFRGKIRCAVDMNDKILIVDVTGFVRLMDSDFNQAEVKFSKYAGIRCWKDVYQLRYKRQRNQFLLFHCCKADVSKERRPLQRMDIIDVSEVIISDDHVPWNEQSNIYVRHLNEDEVANAVEAQPKVVVEGDEEFQRKEESYDDEDSENEDDSGNEENAQNEDEAQNNEGAQNNDDDQSEEDAQNEEN